MHCITWAAWSRLLHAGHIISDWQPLRHFCLEQLRRIWLFLRCNLQLSDEERSFLILQALHHLFEVRASIIVRSCIGSTCNEM